MAKNKRLHAEIISTRHNYLEKQFRECIKPAYYFVEIPTIENILRDFISKYLNMRILFNTLYDSTILDKNPDDINSCDY